MKNNLEYNIHFLEIIDLIYFNKTSRTNKHYNHVVCRKIIKTSVRKYFFVYLKEAEQKYKNNMKEENIKYNFVTQFWYKI